MLSKVTIDNWNLGTKPIIQYAIKFPLFINIWDNLKDSLLIKNNAEEIFIFNYLSNTIIKNNNRIRLKILEKYFWKQSDSFDQNNILIANKIRSFVIKEFNSGPNTNSIIGIGGEYYVYFPFIKASKYIGISNHQSIISDADYNLNLYRLANYNYLVNYNDINTFPKLDINLDFNIIINVSNIHQNHINWIVKLNIKKLIIITCKPIYKKLSLIKKYFNIKYIKHFINFNSIVYVIVCVLKNKLILESNVKYISLGSNCSVTWQLNKYNQRTNSFPFDWTKITIRQLINILENNFNSYTNIYIKKLSQNHLDHNLNPTLLLTNQYSVSFAHEVISNSESNVNQFKIKLENRIKNFLDLKSFSKDKIKFIRIELSICNSKYFDKINNLLILLEKYTGHNEFKFILIIHSDSIIPSNLSNKIQICKFDQFNSDWKMDNIDWKNIF
jgi:hypothetical protein